MRALQFISHVTLGAFAVCFGFGALYLAALVAALPVWAGAAVLGVSLSIWPTAGAMAAVALVAYWLHVATADDGGDEGDRDDAGFAPPPPPPDPGRARALPRQDREPAVVAPSPIRPARVPPPVTRVLARLPVHPN